MKYRKGIGFALLTFSSFLEDKENFYFKSNDKSPLICFGCHKTIFIGERIVRTTNPGDVFDLVCCVDCANLAIDLFAKGNFYKLKDKISKYKQTETYKNFKLLKAIEAN